jgi:hypothetical protein
MRVMTKVDVQEIVVDGETYVKSSSVQALPKGPRVVVVVDRGWIFAGDVTEEDGRVYLDNALWVFRWEGVGFDGMIANPKSGKVTIKPLATRVDLPASSEVFRVPVDAKWGL